MQQSVRSFIIPFTKHTEKEEGGGGNEERKLDRKTTGERIISSYEKVDHVINKDFSRLVHSQRLVCVIAFYIEPFYSNFAGDVTKIRFVGC